MLRSSIIRGFVQPFGVVAVAPACRILILRWRFTLGFGPVRNGKEGLHKLKQILHEGDVASTGNEPSQVLWHEHTPCGCSGDCEQNE